MFFFSYRVPDVSLAAIDESFLWTEYYLFRKDHFFTVRDSGKNYYRTLIQIKVKNTSVSYNIKLC